MEMNISKTAILLIFLLSQFHGFSQNILKGTVKDSMQNPLPYANIIAEPQDSLGKIQFAITGEGGRYVLELEDIPYTVTASFMGFESFSFELHPKQTVVKDIILEQKAEGLQEVVIDLPVVVKEDTITYNVEKLVTGEERKLEDILEKLPGVEIGDDGSITVRGKTITTMLVENRKFFGGGTKLAIENIPADAVYQVEVLENYNEIAFLKNLQDSDETAMNINLKEDRKDFVFGDIEAGKGNQDFYRAHTNLFYYSSKTTLNAIGNLNNTGEQVFTYRQYFDFQGSINDIFEEGNTNFDLPNDDFLQFIEKNDIIKSDRQFGALNFTQEVNNKLNIAAYGIFSNTKEGTYIEATNQYNTFTETKEVSSGTENVFAIGNIKAEYLPSLTDQWHFRTQFKNTDDQYSNSINSLIGTTTNSFFTERKIREKYFDQVIEWHKKSSTEHTFSFGARYTFDQRSPRTIWKTSDPILQGLVPLIEEPIYRLSQVKRSRSNELDAIFKHYWVLNRNNHVYSTIGNTFLDRQFFTRDIQELNDGNINDLKAEDFGNDLDFRLNDLFLGLQYKFKTGIFTFDQGAYLHHYNWSVKQQNEISKSKILILPNFSAEAKLSLMKELKFDYELKTFFSDASRFAKDYYLSSYNAVVKGNENLENERSHSFRLRYTKFSTYRGARYYATANYTKKVKGIQNALNYEGIHYSLMPVLLDNPEERWSFYGNVKKKIKDINFGLGLRYYASEFAQQVNGILKSSKSQNFSYDISAKTLFDNFPIIEVGLKQSIGTHRISGGQESDFLITEPFLKADYDFLDGFIASLDFTSYNYRNESLNLRNNYQVGNASLYYRQDSSAWSFEVEAQNLFDVEFKNKNSFSSYVISDTRTYILPRIIMFTVGYNL